MNILKRELAPLSRSAWDLIDENAKAVLKSNLSARKFIDVDGPKGINCNSLNLGRLSKTLTQDKNDVQYSTYMVQPLVESRVNFSLSVEELDNIERGALDIQFDPLINAALNIALFEENAIYKSLKDGNIKGIYDSAENSAIPMKLENNSIIDSIFEGQQILLSCGAGGKSYLIVNKELWKFMSHPLTGGNSFIKLIEKQIKGSVIYSNVVKGAILASARGGDFILTLGQDFSVGYNHHTEKEISLFIMESFTFRVVSPEALVTFTF